MNKFNLVKEMFENAQNPENAAAMSAYMKNKFDLLISFNFCITNILLTPKRALEK